MDDPLVPNVPEQPQPVEPRPPQKSEEALSRTLLLIGLILVAGAIVVYYFSPGLNTSARPAPRSADQSDVPVLPIPVPAIRGTPAVAFELPNLQGETVRLADFKGKVLLINFWATWCNPCLTEIPWFLEFKERYGPQGFDVVAVNIHDEDQTAVMPFVVKHNMRPLNVVIGTPETDAQFGGFSGLPYSFLVDRDGKFFSKHIGLVDKEQVEDEIRMLLERSPAKSESSDSTSEPSAESAKPKG